MRAHPHVQTHNQAPKKYDPPPCPANTHKLQHTNQTYISVASADKGQAGSSQSAPGSVLIKERVAAPSMQPGLGQEKKDEVDWVWGRGIRAIMDKKTALSYSLFVFLTILLSLLSLSLYFMS